MRCSRLPVSGEHAGPPSGRACFDEPSALEHHDPRRPVRQGHVVRGVRPPCDDVCRGPTITLCGGGAWGPPLAVVSPSASGEEPVPRRRSGCLAGRWVTREPPTNRGAGPRDGGRCAADAVRSSSLCRARPRVRQRRRSWHRADTAHQTATLPVDGRRRWRSRTMSSMTIVHSRTREHRQGASSAAWTRQPCARYARRRRSASRRRSVGQSAAGTAAGPAPALAPRCRSELATRRAQPLRLPARKPERLSPSA